MSVNKVILLGYVWKDPEVKKFKNGGETVKVSLVTGKKGYTTQDGKEVPEQRDWHTVIFGGNFVNFIQKCVAKGDQLYVEGEIHYRDYERDGVKHFVTEIFGTAVSLIPNGNKKNEAKPREIPVNSRSAENRQHAYVPTSDMSGGSDLEDLPF